MDAATPLPDPALLTRFQRGGHPSLRAAIGDAIRAEIMAGRLPPGKMLSIKELQRRFRVSLSAVREALCQLAADGLVVAEEQRGFRVAPISLRDLEDVARTRIEIESFALRDAIANGTTEWEGRLLALLHRMERETKPSEPYGKLHRAFHEELVAPCTSEWMKRFLTTLQEHYDRYRRLAAAHWDGGRDIDGEHRAMTIAVLAHDPERAVALIAEHVRETVRILVRRQVVE